MTKHELALTLQSHPYQFAKSMPFIPHWYTLREKWQDPQFEEAVQEIREHGYDENFGKRVFRYFNANGYKYWSMGAPVEETILINRANMKYNNPYNDIAYKYDELYATPECYIENAEVMESLQMPDDSKVLDIGCGTGLFLDNQTIHQFKSYKGIDSSWGMLQILKSKHEFWKDNVVCCSFEDFYDPTDYDYVISLFGSPSYIEQSSVDKLVTYCLNKKCFLMFYRDNYLPDYEKNMNVITLPQDTIFDIANKLEATCHDYKQFIVVQK